ncbi:MAG: MFS transporter [Lachnospiraceae bacterium]|nr:MFS transporter [Lachnospiraceae bacterium]
MAFISLMFMMIFLVMAAVGVVFLLIAMIFFLINRHRLKKGKEKKRRYKVAGIFFLVLSGINLVPILFMTFLSILMTVVGMLVDEEYTPVTYPIIGVVGLVLLAVAYGIRRWSRHRYQEGEKPGRRTRIVFRLCLFLGCISLVPGLIEGANRVSDHIKLAVMPERAEMWIYQQEHDESEEEQDDWDEEEEQEVLEYKNKEYLLLPYDPDEKKIKFSKPKAYVQYGGRRSASGEEIKNEEVKFEGIMYEKELDSILYEVENETGYDLLCLGMYGKYMLSSYMEEAIYCRKDQYDQFIQACKADAEYYLVPQERSGDNDEEEETEKLFLSDSDWITDEMLDSVENEDGQTFPAPEKYYELHMTGMDGIVSGECDIDIGKYKDKWYYYSKCDYPDQEGCVKSEEDQLYVINGCLLPEKGQHYMDTLK